MLSAVRYSCGVAAHDAGQRLDLVRIGNDAHLIIHCDCVAIKELELLSSSAPTHVQAALNFVQIKDMGRPPELEHHVIGNVHQSRDAALAATRQALHHPLGGVSAGVDIANYPTRKTTAQLRRADLDGQRFSAARRNGRELTGLERRPRQGRHFPCHTVHAEAMRQIGRELQREQGVIQVEAGPNILAQR